MISLVFCIYCILQLLFIYSNVFGEEDVYRRYIVETDFKPPIFGSYSYDPIKQEFDFPNRPNNLSQIVNSSYVLSTAIGMEYQPLNSTDAVYRQHATAVTQRATHWWAKKLGKTTKNPHG